MNDTSSLTFDTPTVHAILDAMADDAIDGLRFGVIGIDAEGLVRRYNAFEAEIAGLTQQRVIGHPLFTVVAPCMNNYLVAQRFEDASTDDTALDATIDYVFTLRMRPSKVKLRLLSSPARAMRYVLVHRSV